MSQHVKHPHLYSPCLLLDLMPSAARLESLKSEVNISLDKFLDIQDVILVRLLLELATNIGSEQEIQSSTLTKQRVQTSQDTAMRRIALQLITEFLGDFVPVANKSMSSGTLHILYTLLHLVYSQVVQFIHLVDLKTVFYLSPPMCQRPKPLPCDPLVWRYRRNSVQHSVYITQNSSQLRCDVV